MVTELQLQVLDPLIDAVFGQFLKVFTVLPLKYGVVVDKEITSAAVLVILVLADLLVDMQPRQLRFNPDGNIPSVQVVVAGTLAGMRTKLAHVSVEVVEASLKDVT